MWIEGEMTMKLELWAPGFMQKLNPNGPLPVPELYDENLSPAVAEALRTNDRVDAVPRHNLMYRPSAADSSSRSAAPDQW
jgi:hypothetical protein